MENGKVHRSIVLMKEQAVELEKIAKKKYMSVNDVIRQAIDFYIKKDKKNDNE